MTIGSVNGHPVYKITRNEVDYKPSAFMQAYETWEEGTKKSQLSEEELSSLKEKYNSNNMTDKETIQLFGDLIKAGVLSKNDAHKIYTGVIPLDVSNYDGTSRGTLSKCNSLDPVRHTKGGFANMPGEGDRGYSNFASVLNQLKNSDAQRIDISYVHAYDGFMRIMEQLRRETMVKTY